MQTEAIRAVKARTVLSRLIGQTVRLRRSGSGFIGRCPFHNDSTPSFHVADYRGTYKCFGCNAQGDAIDWLMQTGNMTFPCAIAYLSGDAGAYEFAEIIKEMPVFERHDETRRIRHAHELWLKRTDLDGTPAESYLRKVRKITGPLPVMLGAVETYCSLTESTVPALVAPLQNAAGHVTAVQQIYLGCEIPHDAIRDDRGHRLKRTFGVMSGAAVRLGMPDTVLGIAGSVEDALAASQLFSLPVWATCGEARMGRIFIPDDVEHVVIFADSDAAGMALAQEAAGRISGSRRVEIMAPDDHKDWNDYLKAHS